MYQVFFRWKTKSQIIEELSWDWDQLDDTESPDADTRMKNKKNLLLLVAGLDHKDLKYQNKIEFQKHIPKTDKDIIFCPKVLDKLDKQFEIHSGRGRMLLDDRMYVRDTLAKSMEDDTLNAIMDECGLYGPFDYLEGLELIDAPGSGTGCPLEQVYNRFF